MLTYYAFWVILYLLCLSLFSQEGLCFVLNVTECPAGTFGLNCSSTCRLNYYGRLCKKECNCTDGQYCDPVHGCLNNLSDTTERITVQGLTRSFECESNIGRCCANYYKVNGNCTECPAGTFGLNCSGTCPKNYYGLFCEEECSCSDGQNCDSINGCIQNVASDNLKVAENKRFTHGMETIAQNKNADYSSSTKALTTTPIFEDMYVWKNITFAFIGSIVTALAVATIMCIRSRLKKNHIHQSLRCHGEDQSDLSAPRQDHGEANIENINLVQEHANEETSDDMNNFYDDLRSSKLLDTYSNVTKKNSFATCSTKNEIPNGDHCDLNNEFLLESQLMYTNSNEETNAEDESVPNYEQFQMPFQYSILSLKRNLDPSVAELYGKTEYNNADVYDFANVYENSGSSSSSNSQSEMDTCLTILKTDAGID